MFTEALTKQFPEISIDYVNHIVILQLGCGGTGGYFAQNLAQYLLTYQYKCGEGLTSINWLLFDGDIVEDKNIYRQNFSTGHIGVNKAHIIASKIKEAYPPSMKKDGFIFRLQPIPHYMISPKIANMFGKSTAYKDMAGVELFDNFLRENNIETNSLFIIVDCLDSIEARLNCINTIFTKLKDTGYNYRIAYCHSGNSKHEGVVRTDLLGVNRFYEAISNFEYPTKNKLTLDEIHTIKAAKDKECYPLSIAYLGNLAYKCVEAMNFITAHDAEPPCEDISQNQSVGINAIAGLTLSGAVAKVLDSINGETCIPKEVTFSNNPFINIRTTKFVEDIF